MQRCNQKLKGNSNEKLKGKSNEKLQGKIKLIKQARLDGTEYIIHQLSILVDQC